MTAPELEAYAKLVVALTWASQQLQTQDEFPQTAEPPPYFWTGHLSILEESADLLRKLGIVRSVHRTYDLFKFNGNLDDAATLAKQNVATGPTLDRLVWVYILLREDYSGWESDPSVQFFIDDRPVFYVGNIENAAFVDLARIGYLKRVPGGYAPDTRTEALLQKPFWAE